MKGKVYLVGAGPGDPELITLRALACIKQSDVIIYDYLASPDLLKYAPENAELIYVGKKGGHHTLSQDGINSLLVKMATENRRVVRLKGGDPFIFGRGGEEVEVLIGNEIPFEIVPGVSSAIAAPAYAGIPLTHRDFTSTVAFVTGHEDPKKNRSRIDWSAIAQGIGTIVFLMGVKNLPHITENLIKNGMAPDTPVALVHRGTTPRQITVTGTLDTIVREVKSARLKAPAIIVVGDVVRLREKMRWFENRPLLGKRIVVTRAREQASELASTLTRLGAKVLECPTIKVAPPEDFAPLDNAIKHLSSYEWLVFTSANGVTAFFDRIFEKGLDIRVLSHVHTAVIGPSTKKRLRRFGLKSDIVPKTYRAESVIEAFSKIDINGRKILLPRAKEARPILPVELTKMGAVVDEVTAYRTKAVRENADLLLQHLEHKKIDLVTFTSSSTVKNFKALFPPQKFQGLMQGITTASIGPITSDTARKLGLAVHITAETYTIPGLCDAIEQHFNRMNRP